MDNLYSKNSEFVEVLTIGYTKQRTPLKIIQIKSENLNNNNILWIDGGIYYTFIL